MKLKPYLYLFCISVVTSGCFTTRSIADFKDEFYFKESPKILTSNDEYYLRFVYSETSESYGFFTMTNSFIENDSLIFCLPATASSGFLKGRTQVEEITSSDKIELIKFKKVYWKNRDGTLTPIPIEKNKTVITEEIIEGAEH